MNRPLYAVLNVLVLLYMLLVLTWPGKRWGWR